MVTKATNAKSIVNIVHRCDLRASESFEGSVGACCSRSLILCISGLFQPGSRDGALFGSKCDIFIRIGEVQAGVIMCSDLMAIIPSDGKAIFVLRSRTLDPGTCRVSGQSPVTIHAVRPLSASHMSNRCYWAGWTTVLEVCLSQTKMTSGSDHYNQCDGPKFPAQAVLVHPGASPAKRVRTCPIPCLYVTQAGNMAGTGMCPDSFPKNIQMNRQTEPEVLPKTEHTARHSRSLATQANSLLYLAKLEIVLKQLGMNRVGSPGRKPGRFIGLQLMPCLSSQANLPHRTRIGCLAVLEDVLALGLEVVLHELVLSCANIGCFAECLENKESRGTPKPSNRTRIQHQRVFFLGKMRFSGLVAC